MTSILDTAPYPYHLPLARELHLTLTQLHPSSQAARMLAQRAGIDIYFINFEQPVFFIWKDILEAAAAAGLTRALTQEAYQLLNPQSPKRPFLLAVLNNESVPIEAEPRQPDGSPRFLTGNSTVSEPEALLYYDDLTMPVGEIPAFITTLERLFKLAPAVCRMVVNVYGVTQYGTGFRIGEQLLLTNWHVLHLQSDGTRATAVTAEFGYEDDGNGGGLSPQAIACDVSTIVSNEMDDWGVIHTKEPLLNQWPILKLSTTAPPVARTPAYIIQHPGGERKRIGFVRNQVSDFDDHVLHYLTDTQVGSSGSPVFNAQGQLIALHHAGGDPQEVLGRAPLKKNEGILISRVYNGLIDKGVIDS